MLKSILIFYWFYIFTVFGGAQVSNYFNINKRESVREFKNENKKLRVMNNFLKISLWNICTLLFSSLLVNCIFLNFLFLLPILISLSLFQFLILSKIYNLKIFSNFFQLSKILFSLFPPVYINSTLISTYILPTKN